MQNILNCKKNPNPQSLKLKEMSVVALMKQPKFYNIVENWEIKSICDVILSRKYCSGFSEKSLWMDFEMRW